MSDWLDDALASYSEPPPTIGLEKRILARVQERTRRRRSMHWLTAASCVAAAAVLSVLFWPAPKIAVPIRPVQTASLVIPVHVQTVVAKPRPRNKKPVEPKLQQFPTPTPMTSEERALVQLASGNAKDIPQKLTEFGRPIEPIQVPALEIKPLD